MIDAPIWLREAIGPAELRQLEPFFEDHNHPGHRLPITHKLKTALAPASDKIAHVVPDMFPVRAVAFDKTAQSEWALPWHQDRVIAVAERHDVQGYVNWSKKQGIWHCEPTVSVLERMLFVRIHLDDTDAKNGGMEIAHASHTAGFVTAARAEDIASRCPHDVCHARSGDILILPMLTLHRSLPAHVPSSRRVLRVDYAASSLPSPLQWAI